MQCIDFDQHFSTYITQWMRENGARYGNDMDRMEAQMPEVYLRWSNTPAPWLDGCVPALYFEQFDDADQLVAWLCDYLRQRTPVPDLLMERIVALGTAAEVRLDALLAEEDAPHEAVLTAITLLRELSAVRPMPRYIAWIAACPRADERAEMAAESLRDMGEAVVAPILAALPGATAAAEEIFTDILCNYPGDERIFALALRKFEECTHQRALFASFLGKLGDPRAVPALTRATQAPETNYLDFVEIANALEELGGEPPAARDFENDPYYESLKQVEP